MSSGSAAQTASMPNSSSVRPAAVNRLRRIQVAAVCASSLAARRLPGRVEGHGPREAVEPALGLLHVHEDQGLMRGIVPL